MRCKTVQARLDDHVDGLLPVAESAAIRDHLDSCCECRETSMALKAATASLCTWDEAEPPADCYQKILSRLEALPVEAFERPTTPRRLLPKAPWYSSQDAARFRRVATGGLAAAAAVLGALVVTRPDTRVVRRSRAPTPSVAPAAWNRQPTFEEASFGRPTDSWYPRVRRSDAYELSPR